MMTTGLPDNPRTLEAIGKIILRHAQLDFALRMIIKSLDMARYSTVREALSHTENDRWLRTTVAKAARSRLGEGEALNRILDLLEECRLLTERRNRLTHDIWVEIEEEIMVRKPDHTFVEPPTLEELESLLRDIESLVSKLGKSRRKGEFLAEALKVKKE